MVENLVAGAQTKVHGAQYCILAQLEKFSKISTTMYFYTEKYSTHNKYCVSGFYIQYGCIYLLYSTPEFL